MGSFRKELLTPPEDVSSRTHRPLDTTRTTATMQAGNLLRDWKALSPSPTAHLRTGMYRRAEYVTRGPSVTNIVVRESNLLGRVAGIYYC